jgi:hypothetical protein
MLSKSPNLIHLVHDPAFHMRASLTGHRTLGVLYTYPPEEFQTRMHALFLSLVEPARKGFPHFRVIRGHYG